MAVYRREQFTCGLTACTPGSAQGLTLGNEYGITLSFTLLVTNDSNMLSAVGLTELRLCAVYIMQAGTVAMKKAIMQYKKNIVMKTAVDRVQLKNECCGSVTYLEWFSRRWIDDAYISRNA